MTKQLFAMLFMGALWAAMPAFVHAEDAGLSEADEAKAEEEELAKLPGEAQSALRGLNFKGLFTAQPAGDDQPAIIGIFKEDKATHYVRADNDDVAKELKTKSGQQITVFAKLRNKGKYMIVMSIVPDLASDVNRSKKKGF